MIFHVIERTEIKNIKVNKENVQLMAISDLTTKTQSSQTPFVNTRNFFIIANGRS